MANRMVGIGDLCCYNPSIILCNPNSEKHSLPFVVYSSFPQTLIYIFLLLIEAGYLEATYI